MAAWQLNAAGHRVTVVDADPQPGDAKLFIAGKSGLNVAPGVDPAEIPRAYEDGHYPWIAIIACFPVDAWLTFLEDLGYLSYLGTSRRYLLKDRSAARLIRGWMATLKRARCFICVPH